MLVLYHYMKFDYKNMLQDLLCLKNYFHLFCSNRVNGMTRADRRRSVRPLDNSLFSTWFYENKSLLEITLLVGDFDTLDDSCNVTVQFDKSGYFEHSWRSYMVISKHDELAVVNSLCKDRETLSLCGCLSLNILFLVHCEPSVATMWTLHSVIGSREFLFLKLCISAFYTYVFNNVIPYEVI